MWSRRDIWTGPQLPQRRAWSLRQALRSREKLCCGRRIPSWHSRAPPSWLLPPAPVAKGIHPTAVIAPSAKLAPGVAVGPYAVIEEDVKIGADAEIGAFCFIGRGAQLGEGCRLYPRVTLYAGARLANRVILHSGAVIGSDGFGYVSEAGSAGNFHRLAKSKFAMTWKSARTRQSTAGRWTERKSGQARNWTTWCTSPTT